MSTNGKLTPHNNAETQAPTQPFFRRLALRTAEAVGSPLAFSLAVIATLLWAASGPLYHFSDTWQLVINTTTTIATFLIVFLIQYTQNRDARVMQLKLDELIRAVSQARTRLVAMEDLTDEELQKLQEEFQALHAQATKHLEDRSQEVTSPKEGVKP